jgi:hypothetical protein
MKMDTTLRFINGVLYARIPRSLQKFADYFTAEIEVKPDPTNPFAAEIVVRPKRRLLNGEPEKLADTE